jgi:hypothetical protein
MKTIRELPKTLKKKLLKLPRLPREPTETRAYRTLFCIIMTNVGA